MSSIFIAKEIPNGYSWTITSKLGRILQSAETKYGNRNQEFTILGVEFNTLGYPQIWFPGNMQNIVIQITMDCVNDINRAVYQVSHEVIHCLSPKIGVKATWLEEGLATYFSFEFTKENGHGLWNAEKPTYNRAVKLIEQLFLIDPNIIIKLREKESNLSLIKKEDIISVNSKIPIDLADQLTMIF